jgi:hypothetical protein
LGPERGFARALGVGDEDDERVFLFGVREEISRERGGVVHRPGLGPDPESEMRIAHALAQTAFPARDREERKKGLSVKALLIGVAEDRELLFGRDSSVRIKARAVFDDVAGPVSGRDFLFEPGREKGRCFARSDGVSRELLPGREQDQLAHEIVAELEVHLDELDQLERT